MKTIDNSGAGNCMYYAYSISLMYFLRQKDDKTRTAVFNKLKLDDTQKKQLDSILIKDSLAQFGRAETKIIENILGPACRHLGADNTEAEFFADPANSSTVTVSVYGIARALKQYLPANIACHVIVPVHPDPKQPFKIHPDFDAEIYRVPGMEKDMDAFSKKECGDTEKLFREHQQLYRTNPQGSELTDKNIIDKIIHDKTVEFFTKNDHSPLKKYIAHLRKDTIWGTEETLLCLHRAIGGERRIANNNWVSATPVSIEILKNNHVNPWQ
jgi:hypothetical protein